MIEMLTGAGILLTGMVIGRLWPARRKGVKPTKPICGCSHGLAFHDPKTGECNGTVERSKYNSVGDWVGRTLHACACLQYTGPEPLDVVYAREIAQ